MEKCDIWDQSSFLNKQLFSVCLLALLSLFSNSAIADPLIVTYRLDSAPIQFQNEAGEADGILIDFWRLWSEKSGIPLKFKGAYNTEAQSLVAEHQANINAGLFPNKERRKKLDFSDTILSSPYHLYLNTSINISLEQALNDQNENISIGVTRGSFHENFLRENYPTVSIKLYDGYSALFSSAISGEIEAFISQPVYWAYFQKQQKSAQVFEAQEPPLYTHGYQAGVVKGNHGLIKLINRHMKSISADEKARITQKWLGVSWFSQSYFSDLSIQLTQDEKDWLNQHNEFYIGIDTGWPPIEYINAESQYSGIASDYVRLFEQHLKVNMQYDASLKWSHVIENIKAGKIDILPAVSITPERQTYLLFTRPYLKFPYVLFTRDDAELITGLDELIGETIVVEKNYANHDFLKKDYPDITLHLVDTAEQALRAVSLGDADAYMGNLATTTHILLEEGIANVKVAAPTPYSNDLAFAIRKDLPELVGILQKALDAVTVEQANQFKKKWFSVRYDYEVDYSLVFQVTGIGLLSLTIVVIWLLTVKRQKEALKVKEERFRLVMEATQDGIWDWKLSGENIYLSPGFYHILGYLETDFPNTIYGIINLIHPDDRHDAKVFLGEINNESEIHSSKDFRFKHKNGDYHILQTTGKIIIDEMGKPFRSLGNLSDVTEKKAAEEKIKKNEQQLKMIIDAIPLAIIICDDDGTIVFANRQTEKESGSEKEAVGLNMQSFYEDPEERDELYRIYRQKGYVDAMPMRYKALSGNIVEGIISMIPVFFDGKIRNLGVLVNLTERIKMEKDLRLATERADAANKTKSQFLANMSHEIRTPMNAIIGLSHLIGKTELNDRQLNYIKNIRISAHSLLGVINDVLDFSKIEAGRLTIESTEFSLDDVMQSLTSLVSLRAEEKDIEILFNINADIPFMLIGDPLRLGQILINLTQNAIKFSEQGSVLIKIKLLEQYCNKVRLCFSVADTGIGIEADKIPHLFDAFSQADESHTRRFGGTGLGLAICKHLVDLMGGSISVQSTPGLGSTFSFELSFDVSDSKQKLRPVEQFEGKRALVVDDNETACDVLSSMLKSFLFDVDVVTSGEDAITKLDPWTETTHEKYDLILVDWKMPGLSGIETVRGIRKMLPANEVPSIIMVTSYGREEIMHEADQAGLDGFLIKPISPSLLFNSIMEIIYNKPYTDAITTDTLTYGQLSGHVLLVEDNKLNQQVAQEVLENMSLDVEVVSDGGSALEKLRKESFDLVLTDIQMPVMDGYELTKRIRKEPTWETLPVIAMTAHAMAGDRKKSLEAGMNDHVPKPIDPDVLFQTLEKWLGNQVKPLQTIQSKEAPIALPTQINGIDIPWGLQRIGGNRNLFSKLLSDFYQDYVSADKDIMNAIETKDTELSGRLLHTIQGIAGNIGARKLQDASIRLSREIKSGNELDPQVYQHFQIAFDEIRKGLHSWLYNKKDLSEIQ